MFYDDDDTELDDTEMMEIDPDDEPMLIDRSSDPVDVQIAMVLLSASELAKHTPVADILPQIGGSLGELWSAAEASGDQTALAHIQAAWDNVNVVAQRAQAHGENAAAAIAALGAVKTQRDQAHATISDLSMQVDELQSEIEYIQESAYGDFMQGIYDNGGHVLDEPEADIWNGIYDNVEGLEADMMPSPSECGQFFEYLVSCPCKLDEALELIAFMKAFTTKVEARRKADWNAWQVQHNAKVAAMRAAQGGAP